MYVFPVLRAAMVLLLIPQRVKSGPTRHIIAIGETGAGKSTLLNEIIGERGFFEFGDTLDSCTSRISTGAGTLFGDTSRGVLVRASDTGGLGDTDDRNDDFLDDLFRHVRSIGGGHGFVYVHNACNKRLDAQARKTLRMMVSTLGNGNKEELADRLAIVMTQCTHDPARDLYEKSLPPILCKNYQLCNVPIFWYDDHNVSSWSLGALLGGAWNKMLLRSSWRNKFTDWVEELPSRPMHPPSKREESWEDINVVDHAACFSPDSTVVDRERGTILIKDLEIGSKVATADGWATVATFLHWHPNETVGVLKISHDQGNLTLSPEHMVFIMTDTGKQHAVPAKKLKAGSKLVSKSSRFTGEHRVSLVHSVNSTTMDGYYAPLTSSGTILVDNAVASCYNQYGSYELSHWVIHILMAPLRIAPTLIFPSNTPAPGDIPPICSFA